MNGMSPSAVAPVSDPSGVVLSVVLASAVFIIVYYLLVSLYYLTTQLLGLLELRENLKEVGWDPRFSRFESPFYPGVALLVPAYNEEKTVVESVRSLLTLNYPDMEVVVVNDGSTDATLGTLTEEFDLEPLETDIPYEVPSKRIRDVYRSRRYEEILVVDKENGGKSDALNAGLWLTEKELFCAVDADTILGRDSLLQIVRPFLRDPERTVATGGMVRIANSSVIEDGVVKETRLPRTGLAGLQVMEYLRAFYAGRLGLSRIRGLILISGAFGVFRSDYVRDIGGYREDTTTEDFDIVLRLHRYLIDKGTEYRIDFAPEPVAWTEVPSDLRTLGKQRRRWYKGMLETVVTNRGMFFNPRYGRIGMFVLPAFTAAEALGRLIEGYGYLMLPVLWYFDLLNVELLLVFFLITSGFGIVLSWLGILSEVWSFNRYERPGEVLRLLWYGVLENIGYRQWKVFNAWRALYGYLRGDSSWGDMTRTGFGGDDSGDED